MIETNQPEQVTLLLARARNGDDRALDQLLPLVYDVLRRLSRRERCRSGNPSTISTTELVHEAYLKLAPGTDVSWTDRAHFYRVAARAMRQVLVDRARRRAARDRKEEALRLSLDGNGARFPDRWDDLLALDRALQRLDETDTRLHEVVELRFFGGLNEEEVADALGVSARTVRRDWMKARLILHRALFPDPPDERHEA